MHIILLCLITVDETTAINNTSYMNYVIQRVIINAAYLATYILEIHFFMRRETLYAELVRSSERLESVSPSQVKEATAEDELDGPLLQVKFSVQGGKQLQ